MPLTSCLGCEGELTIIVQPEFHAQFQVKFNLPILFFQTSANKSIRSLNFAWPHLDAVGLVIYHEVNV